MTERQRFTRPAERGRPKRVGYGKLSRVLEFDKKKWRAAGDDEAPLLLLRLAREFPDVTWVNLSRTSGWEPPLPNIENPFSGPEYRRRIKEIGANAQVGDHASLYRVNELNDEMMFPLMDTLDDVVLWVGQLANSNSTIPDTKTGILTRPLVNHVVYAGHIIRGLNYWKRGDRYRDREEVYLSADIRNMLRARDLKWPPRWSVISQFEMLYTKKCYRYGDPRTIDDLGFRPYGVKYAERGLEAEMKLWEIDVEFTYDALELIGMSGHEVDETDVREWDDRVRFGILINENRNAGLRSREYYMREWIRPLDADYIHGAWSAETLRRLEMSIEKVHLTDAFAKIAEAKSTFTTPPQSKGIATRKPWEAFSVRTVCFFAPDYDTQGHILPTREQILSGEAADRGVFTEDEIRLAYYLRVDTPEELAKKVDEVHSSRTLYTWCADVQETLYERRFGEDRAWNTILERIGLR